MKISHCFSAIEVALDSLTQKMQEQGRSLETTSAAMEEFAASVQNISEN